MEWKMEALNGSKKGEVKFNSDHNLSLNEILKFHTLVVNLILKKMVNSIHKFSQMKDCMSYCLYAQYDRIDISEGICINKTNASKKCDISHYLYFKGIGLKYERYL